METLAGKHLNLMRQKRCEKKKKPLICSSLLGPAPCQHLSYMDVVLTTVLLFRGAKSVTLAERGAVKRSATKDGHVAVFHAGKACCEAHRPPRSDE